MLLPSQAAVRFEPCAAPPPSAVVGALQTRWMPSTEAQEQILHRAQGVISFVEPIAKETACCSFPSLIPSLTVRTRLLSSLLAASTSYTLSGKLRLQLGIFGNLTAAEQRPSVNPPALVKYLRAGTAF